MPAVRLLGGSALTISFGSACRGYTFDRSVFIALFQKDQGLGFMFRVFVFGLGFGFSFRFNFWV